MAKRYHGEMQYEVSEGESVVGALTRMERLRAFILGKYGNNNLKENKDEIKIKNQYKSKRID